MSTPLLSKSGFYRKPLFIAAHADDESLLCGTILQRAEDPTVVVLTDGAPRDPFFWIRYQSRESYAAIREREARKVLALLGPSRLFYEQDALCVDQELYLHLQQMEEYLASVVEQVEPGVLITLAYEGGHPDHDACSFLVSVIGARYHISVWECPAYHRAYGSLRLQEFIVLAGNETVIVPNQMELSCKRAALRVYASQANTLASFNPDVEQLRPQAAYAYSRRPHAGLLNYETWNWPAKGDDVSQAFADHLAARRKQAAKSA